MRCDELKAYNVVVTSECNDYICGQEQLAFEAYAAYDVDAAIAEQKAENRMLKRTLWLARAKAAKAWVNFWFDVAPSDHIKYDRIGRMEGVEKEFVLTKINKHLLASEWVGLWEKIDRLCFDKAEEYK